MVPFEITLKNESLLWILLTYVTRFGNGETSRLIVIRYSYTFAFLTYSYGRLNFDGNKSCDMNVKV